jgi:hypothetical protein
VNQSIKSLWLLCALLAAGGSANSQTWKWADQLATYSSGGAYGNVVQSVSVDPNENIAIGGNYGDSASIGGFKLKTPSPSVDMYVARLNSSGQVAWARSLGSTSTTDELQDVVADSVGNVYVCGYFDGQLVADSIHLNAVSISHVALVKYNSSGAVLWARLIWNATAPPGALLIDHEYIYAAVNRTISKYAPNGDTVWTRAVPNNVSTPVEYNDIAADTAGNLYVTGLFTGVCTFGSTTLHASTVTDADVVIVKYDSDGNIIWARRAGAAAATPVQQDLGHGIAVSRHGDVYVVGQYTGKADFGSDSLNSANASSGMFVAKYTTDGDEVWALGGSGTNGSSSKAYKVAILANDDILVEADFGTRVNLPDTTYTIPGGGDVLVLRFGPDGKRRWGKRSDTFATANNGYGMALSPLGNDAYLGGMFNSAITFGSTSMTIASGNSDGWVGKMSIDALTDVQDISDGELPKSFGLKQNYPNPFNPSTTIEFTLPTRSHVSIDIFNILGEQVRRLIDETRSAGSYRVVWDGTDGAGAAVSTGVYYYRLQTSDLAESRKMLLLK